MRIGSATGRNGRRSVAHREAIMTESRTQTLDVPGAVLTYDVRSNDSTTEPPLLLIGSPMAASGFVTLAGHFPDRTVATYDPRGSEGPRRLADVGEWVDIYRQMVNDQLDRFGEVLDRTK